jgi:alkanesulfonate monooxygenase SsuD/methylene tetrahydromethanopterin reductase-like flavin-dependent oxidoreductase (luciferase family)
MLDFGATFVPDPPSRLFVDRIVRAEELGFTHGWTYDSHILWQEGYVFLTLAASWATASPTRGSASRR